MSIVIDAVLNLCFAVGYAACTLPTLTSVPSITPTFVSQSISSDPNLEEILIRGMEKGIQGDYQGAIADFTEVIRLNPYEVEAYYNRGIAYRKIHDYSQAIADFDYALSLDKELAEVYLERAKVRLILDNPSGATRDLRTALQLFKTQGNAFGYQETQKLLREVLRSPKMRMDKNRG